MSILNLETNDLVEKTSSDGGLLIRDSSIKFKSDSKADSSRSPHYGEEDKVSLKNTFNAAGEKLTASDKLLNSFFKKEVSSNGLFGLSEGVSLLSWQRVANISSKILYFDDDVVQIECLVDKENKLYEQKEFNRDFFVGLDLSIGYQFKLCFYKRNNQQMVEVMYDSQLVASDDFSSADFLDDVDDLITNRIID